MTQEVRAGRVGGTGEIYKILIEIFEGNIPVETPTHFLYWKIIYRVIKMIVGVLTTCHTQYT